MRRIYESMIMEHLKHYRQMVFLVGPRQAGKTTAARMAGEHFKNYYYLNWDNLDHRRVILGGVENTAGFAGLDRLSDDMPLIVFDEIHKYGKWKIFLKGFFDTYKEKVKIIVTGSSRLDIYKKGGDSLMGRYFTYRLHQLSQGEVISPDMFDGEIRGPSPERDEKGCMEKLLANGGFPEPFMNNSARFLNRWKNLRREQLIREDIRELSRVQELGQIELLAETLNHRSGQLTNYSSLASKISVSSMTVSRWIKTLQGFFYLFTVYPWSKNIPRALIKEPKVYLWDWVDVQDEGGRWENLVGSHLLKAVHYWTDMGFGNFALWFVRDKEKREVDFLVTRDKKPWFLAEAKLSHRAKLSKNLEYFQAKTGAAHAFQVVRDMDYVQSDCFKQQKPVIVPGKTFLSQLV